MRRALPLLALALVSVAGTAGASTFRILPTAASNLPSAQVPNAPGQIATPASLDTPPAQPQQLTVQQLEPIWQQAGAAYGIPWQVLAAINEVESNFGRNMGPSSAGAVGWMQFMPDTWLRWGVDANGDGLADPWTAEDAIYAAARYLAASGGQTDIARAVLSYNHAQWYVNEVLQLANTFRAGGATTTFNLDRLQVSLDPARRDVVRINRQLVGAVGAQRRLARIERRWLRRADAAQLLSTQLELQKHATLAGVRAHTAALRVGRLRAALEQAQQALAQAKQQTTAAATSPAVGTAVFDAPTAQAGYVFPVGGGPSVVSVAHTHHDYPAADIAAPEGSPVYALGDAIVLRAWQAPDPRCGIGLTLQTSDGLTWTYCHLAYLEPTVRAGVALSAGAAVGLVGQTGDATGPHLHLQIDPPTSYPQAKPWFQRFAGVAFRWQDAPTPAPASAADVVFRAPASSSGVIRFTR